MNVEKLAEEVGRQLGRQLKLAYKDEDDERYSTSDLLMPGGAAAGAAAGGYLAAHSDAIKKLVQRDPDLSRMAQAIRGVARRLELSAKRNPITSGALMGAGVGAGVGAAALGGSQLIKLLRQRDQMMGQLSNPNYGQGYGQGYQGG